MAESKNLACPVCRKADCYGYSCQLPVDTSPAESRGDIEQAQILTDQWTPGLWEADDAVMARRNESVARAQQTQRNDPMFAGHSRAERAAMFGSRLRLQWMPNSALLGRDECNDMWAMELADQVEDEWYADNETPCYPYTDAAGRNTFTGNMHLLRSEFVGTGECMTAFERMENEEERPTPTAMAVLDSSRLVTPAEFLNSGSVKNGVRVDKNGAPKRWYVHKEHPTHFYRFSEMNKKRNRRELTPMARGTKKDYTSYFENYSWGKPRFVHSFDKTRAGQNRSLPDITPALPYIKAFSQLTTTAIQAAFRDAVFAMWMQSQDPAAIGQMYTNDKHADPLRLYTGVHTRHQQMMNMHKTQQPIQMSGRELVPLLPGTEIQTSRGGFDKSGQKEFNTALLTHVARAAEVDIPSYTGDWSQINFSGGRTGVIQTYQSRLYQANRMVQRHGTAYFMVWFEEKIAKGVFKMPPGVPSRIRAQLNFFYNNRAAFCSPTFVGPGRDHVDEIKGIKRWTTAIKGDLSSHTEYFNQHSQMTYREHMRMKARERHWAENFGCGEPLPAPELESVAGDVSDRPDPPDRDTT
jgi:capsid protein